MLDYSDLIAGRTLIAMGALDRGEVIKELQRHDLESRPRGRFINYMVEEGVVARAIGRDVYNAVARHRRSLAQAVFLECLNRRKRVDTGTLAAAVEQYEKTVNGPPLDQVLQRWGLITEWERSELRTEALDCLERQQTSLLSKFRMSLKHHNADTEILGGVTSLRSETSIPLLWDQDGKGGSTVAPIVPMTSEKDRAKSMEIAAPVAITQTVARRLVSTTGGIRVPDLPRFPVPDWIRPAGMLMGKLIAGYRIFGKIGEGGMGIVYYAEHVDLDEPIALKLLPPDRRADEDALGRFHREILAMSFFDNENVVSIKDAGETEDGSMFIAMEFFDSRELMDILEEDDVIDEKIALPIFIQVLHGLHAAHEAGILHRDLKPENVLVSLDGREAKLMDFGIARIMDPSEFKNKIFRSVAGTITGTPEYFSPEQATDLPLDPRSDLYSFGIMMYLCLTGEFPIEADTTQEFITAHMVQVPMTPKERCPFIRKRLSDIVMLCLEKEPEDRYQTALELIVDLEELMAT